MIFPDPLPLAERLVRELRPCSVIDIGVTRSSLPKALEALGVRAVTADPGRVEAALGEVGCDLVVAIGGLDELAEGEARAALAAIQRRGARVLVAPGDKGAQGRTAQGSRSYWSRLFAEEGFFLDVDFDAHWVAQAAMLFVPCRISAAPGSVEASRGELEVLRRRAQESEMAAVDLAARLLAIEGTVAWRLVERSRRLAAHVPRPWPLSYVMRLVGRTVEVLADEGLRAAFGRTVFKFERALGWVRTPEDHELQEVPGDREEQYRLWLERQPSSAGDVEGGRELVGVWRYRPRVSVVVVVRVAETPFLRKAVESVFDQIYPFWELCISPVPPAEEWGREVLGADRATDPRIRITCSRSDLAGVAAATSGELVGFLGEHDRLAPDALLEVVRRFNEQEATDFVYTDEDEFDADEHRRAPFFKPDWSPDLLLSLDYVSRFGVVRRRLLETVATAAPGLDPTDLYDLNLRLTEQARSVGHVPRVLYHRGPRCRDGSNDRGCRAVERALQRRGYSGWVETPACLALGPEFRIMRYALRTRPLVSIVIPTRDRGHLLRLCLQSVEAKTNYEPYEVIVLDNESREPETLAYLASLGGRVRVLPYPGPFNYAVINNFGARQARGEYLLFLNNDVHVIRADWMTGMVEHAQRPEVGAVGAKLLYPDRRIQHGGVLLGVIAGTGHAFRNQPDEEPGYFGLAHVVRNCSAVTAACMMVRRQVFEEVGGFDDSFRVQFNDIDLCLRIRRKGYLVVYTPVATLYHYEGASRRVMRPLADEKRFRARWGEIIRRGDPYYNPNLTRVREDWSLRL